MGPRLPTLPPCANRANIKHATSMYAALTRRQLCPWVRRKDMSSRRGGMHKFYPFSLSQCQMVFDEQLVSRGDNPTGMGPTQVEALGTNL